ncbi:hypothetical protein MMC25_002769 [Agyrium rufum]|nr:hypothetical protein [Agyrium rufum]
MSCHRRISTYTDTASRFHVSQQVGRLDLVGYRDLYSWRFFGVRYAPRPDRFAYSTVYEGAGSTSATQYGSDCLQAPGSGSEDCLFLNIWTPYLPPSSSVPKKRLKPVLLFIFGGGFVSGTANDPGADGGNIASRGDVVVVGIQYRLANLGWLALNDGVANGNYGLSDMITALQWVQQNIKAFGGDPARVTIQGESAGSSAVRALLASPKAKGLFAGAIMESDPGGAAPLGAYAAYGSVTVEYQAIAVPVLNATGCLSAVNQLACLRAVNGTELQTLRAQNAYPMMDNFFLPTDGLQLDGKGYAASVPLLIGTNRDEGGIDVQYLATDNETLALDTLAAIFSYNTSVIQSSGAFPNPSPKNVSLGIFNITARIVTDAGLRCNSQATAYSGSKYHVFPHVYTFEFNRTYQPALFDSSFCDPPKTAQFPLGDANLEYFKCHAGEVSYVFGNLLRLGQPDRDGLDVPFSQLAVDYWSSFVRTGNPNPATGYLEARGYWGTLAQVRKVGQWEAVGGQQAPVRELQWNGAQIPWQDLRQCAVLGYPVTMYE